MNTTPFYDRQLGAFIGLLVGDALGTTLEFCARDSKPLHTEMIGGGHFGLEAGQFTDDTSMALALADSLIENDDFNPIDLMDRFIDWYKNGKYSSNGTCFDIGNATRESLQRYIKYGEPYSGSADPMSSGNGSLMRIAPVAIKYFNDIQKAINVAEMQSRTTHASADCITACQYFTILLCEAIQGVSKDEILKNRQFKHYKIPFRKVNDIAQGIYKNKTRDEIKSSPYVITSLEAALWAVYSTSNFEDALILAVNLGDDADTIGAITGQLAGAIYGYRAIPQKWLSPIDEKWMKHIKSAVRALSQ